MKSCLQRKVGAPKYTCLGHYFTEALQRNISFDHFDFSLIINVNILLIEITQRSRADRGFSWTHHQHNREDQGGNHMLALKESTWKWHGSPHSQVTGQRDSRGPPSFKGDGEVGSCHMLVREGRSLPTPGEKHGQLLMWRPSEQYIYEVKWRSMFKNIRHLGALLHFHSNFSTAISPWRPSLWTLQLFKETGVLTW